jgi:hypothetical protein
LTGERWSRDADLRGYALILFEIIFCHPPTLSEVVNDETNLPSDILIFVRELLFADEPIESGLGQSFSDIFDVLKNSDFGIVSGMG